MNSPIYFHERRKSSSCDFGDLRKVRQGQRRNVAVALESCLPPCGGSFWPPLLRWRSSYFYHVPKVGRTVLSEMLLGSVTFFSQLYFVRVSDAWPSGQTHTYLTDTCPLDAASAPADTARSLQCYDMAPVAVNCKARCDQASPTELG